MRKTKAESAQTREALLDAALEIFYRRGVSQASLQEIASAAGVTRGALYWHFRNKEDLFDALFQKLFSKLTQQMADEIAAQSPDIWQSLAQATLHCFNNLVTSPSYRRFLHILHLNCEHTQQNEKIVALLQKYQNMWYAQLHDTFSLCVHQGILPKNLNVAAAALYFQALIMGLTELWLTNPAQFDIRQVAPGFIQTALGTLQNSPHLLQAETR